MKEQTIEIHETAFATSALRAFDEELSQDTFSKLWNNPKTALWVKEYLNKVSSEETYTHCLRNRFFLDKFKELAAEREIEVLINFGSGFSMYPFLLDEKLVHIEIDKAEVVEYKKQQLNQWQKNNILPQRDIHFIGVDFSKDYKDSLLTQIIEIKSNKPTFVLLEGVLFFLNRKDTNKLFSFFDLIQEQGDFTGCVSFKENVKDTLAFKNLIRFFNQKVVKTSESDYQTIEDKFYQKLSNYTMIDHQDYFSLSKKYNHTVRQDKEMILNENFYILQKNR